MPNSTHLPLVSILVLSMNHEDYVAQCFESIIGQDYPNIEIIYLDNASSDMTFERSISILSRSGRPYKAEKRSKSFGISANFNFLMQQARGEYLAIVSADDWWTTDKIGKQVAHFQAHPQAGLVHTNYHIFDEPSGELREPSKKVFIGKVFNDLLKGNFVAAVSVMLKRDVLYEIGYFDEASPAEDWDMWLRVAQNYTIEYVADKCAYYRVGVSNISRNIAFMDKSFAYMLKKYGMYPEIQQAKRDYDRYKAYYLATSNPDFKTVKFLATHFQMGYTKFFLMQFLRCFKNYMRLKFAKPEKIQTIAHLA